MVRDQKSHRFGLGLGLLKMFNAERLERLLLIIVFTQFIVMAIGVLARAQGLAKKFAANSGHGATQFSDFYLGKFYLCLLPWSPIKTLKAFLLLAQKLRG